MDQKIKPARLKKEAIVKGFTDKLSRAKSVVFTDYQGMTHQQIENLKRAVKNVDAEFVVTKNTLLKLALDQTQNSSRQRRDKTQNFQGPTATLFSFKDVIAPLKELAKVVEALKLPLIKFGIMEGKTIKSADVVKLFSIPVKEVLLAQIVGGLKSPIFGLHRALTWNIQKFVMTLKAIEKTKGVN